MQYVYCTSTLERKGKEKKCEQKKRRKQNDEKKTNVEKERRWEKKKWNLSLKLGFKQKKLTFDSFAW